MNTQTQRLFIAVLFAIAILFPLVCCADVVYLKNGKRVDGEIVKKTEQYVKIRVGGTSLTYFQDEIEEVVADTELVITETDGDEHYVNREWGLYIKGPNEWQRATFRVSNKSYVRLVSYSKHDRLARGYKFPAEIPTVAVDVLAIADIADTEALISYVNYQIEKKKQNKYRNFRLLKGPNAVTINKIRGVAFRYSEEVLHSVIQTDTYLFPLDDDHLAQVVVFSKSEEFQDSFPVFEESIKSFKVGTVR